MQKVRVKDVSNARERNTKVAKIVKQVPNHQPGVQSISSIADVDATSSTAVFFLSSTDSEVGSRSSTSRPSEIMRWMRFDVGSSSAEPEVRSEVSKRSDERSRTLLSALSSVSFSLSSLTVESCSCAQASSCWPCSSTSTSPGGPTPCDMRSMFADHLNWPVASTQGKSVT